MLLGCRRLSASLALVVLPACMLPEMRVLSLDAWSPQTGCCFSRKATGSSVGGYQVHHPSALTRTHLHVRTSRLAC